MAIVDQILIVGGGIGGLSLATALHRDGFTPELVERSPEWRTTGGGIGVLANGMRMLRVLGLDGAVAQAGAVGIFGVVFFRSTPMIPTDPESRFSDRVYTIG